MGAWTGTTRLEGGLETALNESDVVAVRLDPPVRTSTSCFHVIAVPESGPLIKDGRLTRSIDAPSPRFELS